MFYYFFYLFHSICQEKEFDTNTLHFSCVVTMTLKPFGTNHPNMLSFQELACNPSSTDSSSWSGGFLRHRSPNSTSSSPSRFRFLLGDVCALCLTFCGWLCIWCCAKGRQTTKNEATTTHSPVELPDLGWEVLLVCWWRGGSLTWLVANARRMDLRRLASWHAPTL